MKDLVSIVVPCYNVDKYLEECVESIINQTYKNIEVILIDDGSTDNTPSICDKYKSELVKVVHKKNGGLSDARNTGLEMANGKWIYFCDSDDYVDTKMIEELVTVLEKEQSDMCFFDAISFDETVEREITQAYVREIKYKGNKLGIELIEELLINNQYIACVPLHIYKTEFLRKNNLNFQKGMLHEDELFSFYTYVKAKKVSRVKKNFYWRRIRVNSITTETITKKHYEGIEMCCDCIRNYYLNTELDKEEKKTILICLSRMYEVLYSKVIALSDNNIDVFKEFLKSLKETKKKIDINSIELIWRTSLTRYFILEVARKIRRIVG